MEQTVLLQRLQELADPSYRTFMARLIPTVPSETVLGVRTPALRKLAKEWYGTNEARAFLSMVPHTYFEENQLHVFFISLERDMDVCLSLLEAFFPHMDNWATCDQCSPRVFQKHLDQLLPRVESWLRSTHPYTVRFGIKMLMEHFLADQTFSVSFLEQVTQVDCTHYYVHMMVAWYFATALAFQWDATLPFIVKQLLPADTHNQAIQKAIESRRISLPQKELLRQYRIAGALKTHTM